MISLTDDRERERDRDRDLQGERASGLRTPTIRTEDLHYSDKYGTSLVDAQLKAIDENQSKFESSITAANQELTTSRSNVDSKYNEALNKLVGAEQKTAELAARYGSQPDFETWFPTANEYPLVYIGPSGGTVQTNEDGSTIYGYWETDPTSMENYSYFVPVTQETHPDLFSNSGYWQDSTVEGGQPEWVNTKDTIYKQQYNESFKSANPDFTEWYNNTFIPEQTVPFTITNKDNTYKTYRLSPEDAATFAEALNGVEGFSPVWRTEDGGYGKDASGYLLDITQPLEDYNFKMESSMIDAYLSEVKGNISSTLPLIQEQRGYLEQDYSNANALLSQRQREIEAAQTQNTEGLNLIRMKYQEKLGNIRETIGDLTYG